MTLLTILIDGIAYGMVLFVLASGLSVTLGLMNFVNLAHGAFAMVGGYVAVLLMQRHGVPFLATLRQPSSSPLRPASCSNARSTGPCMPRAISTR
jgi:branched-subunit amino acid ABC-type transport system permease component